MNTEIKLRTYCATCPNKNGCEVLEDCERIFRKDLIKAIPINDELSFIRNQVAHIRANPKDEAVYLNFKEFALEHVEFLLSKIKDK